MATNTYFRYLQKKKKKGGGALRRSEAMHHFFLGGSPYPTLDPPFLPQKHDRALPPLFIPLLLVLGLILHFLSLIHLPYSAFSCFLPCKSQPSDHHRLNSGSGIPLSFTATTTYFRILHFFFFFLFLLLFRLTTP